MQYLFCKFTTFIIIIIIIIISWVVMKCEDGHACIVPFVCTVESFYTNNADTWETVYIMATFILEVIVAC